MASSSRQSLLGRYHFGKLSDETKPMKNMIPPCLKPKAQAVKRGLGRPCKEIPPEAAADLQFKEQQQQQKQQQAAHWWAV